MILVPLIFLFIACCLIVYFVLKYFDKYALKKLKESYNPDHDESRKGEKESERLGRKYETFTRRHKSDNSRERSSKGQSKSSGPELFPSTVASDGRKKIHSPGGSGASSKGDKRPIGKLLERLKNKQNKDQK